MPNNDEADLANEQQLDEPDKWANEYAIRYYNSRAGFGRVKSGWMVDSE